MITNLLRRLFSPKPAAPVAPAGPHLLHLIEAYLETHDWTRWPAEPNLWRLNNRDLYSFISAVKTQIVRDGDEVPAG